MTNLTHGLDTNSVPSPTDRTGALEVVGSILNNCYARHSEQHGKVRKWGAYQIDYVSRMVVKFLGCLGLATFNGA